MQMHVQHMERACERARERERKGEGERERERCYVKGTDPLRTPMDFNMSAHLTKP